MTLTYNVFTNIGSREVNEDCVGQIVSPEGHCFIVADGLGGHGHGERASAIAVESGLNTYVNVGGADVLAKSFELAQNRVLGEQELNPLVADMKTTMVDLVIGINGMASWGHIGDSRLYMFRNGMICAHTSDHSVPQMLVNLGEISFEQIRGHEDRNRLIRVIGSPWEGKSYELSNEVPIKPGDAFLLCTDGFWELLDEMDMQRTLKMAKTVEQWMNLMVEIVMRNGAAVDMDNNSAIAVWVNG